jgi:hypothetical protein
VKAQNAVTDAYLAATPGRDAIRDRLTAMWNYPRVSLPVARGGRLFFTKNTGLQKQSPYYTTRGSTAGRRRARRARARPERDLAGRVDVAVDVRPDPTAPTWPTG